MSDEFREALLAAEFSEIVGQGKVKDQLKSALLAGRHVILVGPPGIGKTTLARSVAKLLPDRELSDDSFRSEPREGQDSRVFSGAERFVRVQGSPDLTAEDLLGDIDPLKALEFGPLSTEAFSPGKIFKANHGVLFFDEVNRCSEKLQNALLQVLQEGVATIGSYDVDFPASFLFIGTMNPDDNATEELSHVFLDRFDLVYVSYPQSFDAELRILRKHARLSATLSDELAGHIVRFVRGLRSSDDLERLPSVRATLGLAERAGANALIDGRDEVSLRDISRAVRSVIAHRISLKPSVRYLKSEEQFVSEQFSQYLEDHRLQIGEAG